MKKKKNIKIYVDWDEHTIYTEDELDELKNYHIEDMYGDENALNEWLDDTFCASQVFNSDFDEIMSNWHDYCEERVCDEWETLEQINLKAYVDDHIV